MMKIFLLLTFVLACLADFNWDEKTVAPLGDKEKVLGKQIT
jgi:hypothetical protein